MPQRPIRFGRRVLALNGPTVIDEPFTAANGPLDQKPPPITWRRHVFDQGVEWEISGNQAVFNVINAPGNPTNSYEDLQVPDVQPGSDDARMSYTIQTPTLPAGGSFWVGVGMMGRMSFFTNEFGDEDYYAIGGEFGISNQFLPPAVTAHVIVWKVEGHFNPSLLDIHLHINSEITLPATLTYEWIGDQVSITLDHLGVGPTLQATATDGTFSTGVMGIGGGHVLDPTRSTNWTIDNLQMETVGVEKPRIVTLNVA